MKQILSLFMFGIGALLFLAFLATLNRMTSLRLRGRANPASAARKPRLSSPASIGKRS